MKSSILGTSIFVASWSVVLASQARPRDTNILYAPASAFTVYTMPTFESGPCDVSTGPDNLLYVQEFFSNKIARLNQSSGVFTEYNIPFTAPLLDNFTIPLPGYAKFELLACAIRTGFDGYMYFSNGAHNQLVQHDVNTGKTVVFTPPGGLLQTAGNVEPFNDITTAPDGAYFTQTIGNKITKFDYVTHKFTDYLVPAPVSNPLGIFYASDGGIWFLDFLANAVGRFDRFSETFQNYPLPLNCRQPLVVRAETKNDDSSTTLWFACTTSSSIGGINTRTHQIKVYTEQNAPTLPIEVGQDQAGNIWSTHLLGNTLGVKSRNGLVVTVVEPPGIAEFLPTLKAPSYGGGTGIIGYTAGQPIGRGRKDAAGNAIWYTHFLTNKLIRLSLDNIVIP